MTELKDGLILTVQRLESEPFTYKGKPIKFEKDKDNPFLYRAKTEITDEEKKAGNRDIEFFFNVGAAEASLSSAVVPPDESDNPDFKDLTDSEKITKMNSIAYQYNAPEPTDIGAGLDETLQKSVSSGQQPQLNKEKDQQEQQQQKLKEKQQKEREQQQTNLAEIKNIEDHQQRNKQQKSSQ